MNPPKADVSETGPLHVCGTPLGTTENQCLGMSSEVAEQIALYKGGVHTLLNLPHHPTYSPSLQLFPSARLRLFKESDHLANFHF